MIHVKLWIGLHVGCFIHFGHYISDPPPTPMVHCWCANYPNVTLCSWPEPSVSPPTHYIATYR